MWQSNYGAIMHQVFLDIPSFPTQIFHAGEKKEECSVEAPMMLLLSIKLKDGNEITKCM